MSKAPKKPLLIIYGPTGVGKTALSLAVAHHISAEIINMDVGQLYTPLTIGTAKPDLSTVTVSHHGFNVLDEAKNFTVVSYRTLCAQLIDEIRERGNLPILVGGSGFYLKSLLFPPHDLAHDLSGANCELGSDVAYSANGYDKDKENAINDKTNGDWHKLQKIDPDRAACIHPSDHYRIQRALAIWGKTGEKPSAYKPTFDPLSAIESATILFLTREREELYERIDQRVDSMIAEGWLDEVRTLMGTPWEQFIKQKKLIGYNELVDVLLHANSSDICGLNSMQVPADVVRSIQQRTRHYAKRQGTFWRMLKGLYESQPASVQEKAGCTFELVNLTVHSIEEYGRHIAQELSRN